jgi:pimeloyl-ACP methyl ester carboxylesterase
MNTTMAVREGYIPFHGFRTWFRVVGDRDEPGKLPLLTLHGGPGAAHDYLESLEAMAATGRRVIFYDQLGCGNSGLAEPAPSLWTIPLFAEVVHQGIAGSEWVVFEASAHCAHAEEADRYVEVLDGFLSRVEKLV